MVTFKSHTPPGKPTKRVAADASATARALIAADAVLHTLPTVGAVPPVKGLNTLGVDGLENFAGVAHLFDLEPAVLYTLCVNELLSIVCVRPGTLGNSTADVSVQIAGAPVVVAQITRPTAGDLVGSAGATTPTQISQVATAAGQRSVRAAEIVAQDASLEAHFMDVLRFDEEQYPHTAELIAVVSMFVFTLVQELKYHFMVPRPTQVAPDLTTVVPVPGHSSYPGGHAAQARAIAGVLVNLLLPRATAARVPPMLKNLATRIAENRVIAGLHYPVDSTAGLALGDVLAEVLGALVAMGGSITPQSINGNGATNLAQPVALSAVAPRFQELLSKAAGEH